MCIVQYVLKLLILILTSLLNIFYFNLRIKVFILVIIREVDNSSFLEEGSVEVIPTKWLINNESCMWPNSFSIAKLTSAI